jgi:hypothetical protein
VTTDDEVLRLFERADPARGEPAAPPLDAADYLDAVRTRKSGAEVIVVDLEPTPRERAGHRRWLVPAAAAAAVVLLVGSGLVWSATNQDAETPEPAGPGPTSTTVDPSRAVDAVLPPEGALPSTPETGELVATIAFSRFNPDAPSDTSISLYADGRLVWLPAYLPADAMPRGISERRLNNDGVELVRQEFLAIGITGQQPADSWIWSSCACIIRVRDGDRLLSSDLPPSPNPDTPVDPDLDRRLDHLIEYITNVDSSVPPSGWADREVRPYVPSKYRLRVWTEGAVNQAVPDVSALMAQLLPTPLVERLDAQGWMHTPWEDSVDLTLAAARELALAFAAADAQLYYSWPTFLVIHPRPNVPISTRYSLGLETLLPDGNPPFMAPG